MEVPPPPNCTIPALFVEWDAENKRPHIPTPDKCSDEIVQYVRDLNEALSFKFFAKSQKQREKDEKMIKKNPVLPLRIMDKRNEEYRENKMAPVSSKRRGGGGNFDWLSCCCGVLCACIIPTRNVYDPW